MICEFRGIDFRCQNRSQINGKNDAETRTAREPKFHQCWLDFVIDLLPQKEPSVSKIDAVMRSEFDLFWRPLGTPSFRPKGAKGKPRVSQEGRPGETWIACGGLRRGKADDQALGTFEPNEFCPRRVEVKIKWELGTSKFIKSQNLGLGLKMYYYYCCYRYQLFIPFSIPPLYFMLQLSRLFQSCSCR